MKKTLCIITAAIIILSTLVLSAGAVDSLRFNEDGDFTILQIADTQDDMYPAYELKPFIEKAIEL